MHTHPPTASPEAAPLLSRAGSLASWRAFAAAVLAALPWLNPLADGPTPSVQPWLVSMACTLALWLVAGPRIDAARLRLVGAAAALVAWAALSQMALRPEILFLAAGLALIAFATGIGDDVDIVQGLQAGLLAAAAVSAVLGLVQYFGLAEPLAPLVGQTGPGEAYANLRQPNQYATLLWLGAAVLLWGGLRLPPACALPLMLLLAVASAASVSRTGMLQGLVLTVLAAWWNGPQRRQRLLLCAAAAIGYFAAVALLPLLLQAMTGSAPGQTLWGKVGGGESCVSRVVLWGNVLHLILLKPVFGWGWGELDYAHFMTLYEGARFCDILDNAHNLPLHLAVELGLPAALLVCGLAVLWAVRQRPWREKAPLRRLAWAMLALILLHSLVEYPLWYGPFQLAFGAALGWLLCTGASTQARVAPAAAFATAGVLLAASGYAAWDYHRVGQIYKPPEERRAAWRDNTMEHVRRSWLFSGQGRFAQLTLAPLTRANAAEIHALSQEMLHYSPEPRVVEKLIASAAVLGRDREAALHVARLRAAFPEFYRQWREKQQAAQAQAKR